MLTKKYTEKQAEIVVPTESWANHAATSFAGGKGSPSEPFLVSTPEQLAFVIRRISSNTSTRNLYFKQTANLKMGQYAWPEQKYTFSGNYDGGGYTISGLYTLPSSSNPSVGLFSALGYAACVQNVNIRDSHFEGASIGGLVGGVSNTSTGCQIINCTSNAILQGGGSNHGVGGIVGSVSGNLNVSGCRYYGAATSTQVVGGIVGFSMTSSGITVSINNCEFNGTINGANSGGIGGVFAGNDGSSLAISNCKVEGIINSDYCGGILSTNGQPTTIENCSVNCTISGNGTYLGGIVGNASSAITISKCIFEGFVLNSSTSESAHTGGILGQSAAVSGNKIEDCVFKGTVSGASGCIGGLLGYTDGTYSGTSTSITSCAVYGAIETSTSSVVSVGTLVGGMGVSGMALVTGCSFIGTSNSSAVGAFFGSTKTMYCSAFASYVWLNNKKLVYTTSSTTLYSDYFRIVEGMNEDMPMQISIFTITEGAPEQTDDYILQWMTDHGFETGTEFSA